MNSLTPFSDGYKSRLAGRPKSANPYKSHHKNYMKWLGGWEAADRDAKRHQAKEEEQREQPHA